MNVSKWQIFWFGMAVGILLWLFGFYKAGGKLTYIERTRFNEESSGSITVADPDTVLEQEFTMPYELLWGVELKTGAAQGNINSFWTLELKEAESGKKVYGWEFNASQMPDGEYYSFEAKRPVRVEQGKSYVISIHSKDAARNSALAFDTSAENTQGEGILSLDGKEQEGGLCMRITGGEEDGFWIGWYLSMIWLLLGIATWCLHGIRRGKPVGAIVEAVGVACLYFLFMYIFSRDNTGSFTDEWDNIWGGMLVARGEVIYRDYYTQHTPFGYYLCAFFACLGAGSIQQFRLLYYLLLSMVWGGLYYRHSHYFGKIRMFLLPMAQLWIIMPMFFQSPKILGDNIQGMCMVALVMEFLRYWEEEELGKSRSLIAAVCIFISVTSAFVSVFSLAPVIVGVLIKEFLVWKRKGGFGLKNCVKRYGVLVGATAAPFVGTLLYFAHNHAIRQMYLMAYQFNTMVYNKYQNEYGRVKWKPFVLGIKGFFAAISNNFNKMITADGESDVVIRFLIAVSVVAVLLLWGAKQKKGERIVAVAALFLCMCGGGTRSGTSDEFHSVAMWNTALALIILLDAGKGRQEEGKKNASAILAAAALGVYFLQPYITIVAEHIVYHPSVIEGLEEEVVAMTAPGEHIFIDAVVINPVYLTYKERYPVNRNGFLLPWYMDWFERDTIEDLETGRPRVAVYNPEMDVWGETGFYPLLDQAIQGHYERLAEDDNLYRLRSDCIWEE